MTGTGGLINISTRGHGDIFLIGSPQITFYKMLYRRYTNFAMETFSIEFTDRPDFEKTIEMSAPRIGDLIHKGYLNIKIPKFEINHSDVGIDTSWINFNQNNIETQNYQIIKNTHMPILTEIIRIINRVKDSANITYTDMISDVTTYLSQNGNQTILNNYNTLLNTEYIRSGVTNPKRYLLIPTSSNLSYIINNIDLDRLFSEAQNIALQTYPDTSSVEYSTEINRIMKQFISQAMDRGFFICKQVQDYFYEQHLIYLQNRSNYTSRNIKFAWVEYLGHSIIEHIDIYIGGKRIDRHLGVWLSIIHQLTYKSEQIDIYNRLIGNLSILTNFDYDEKPSYDLYIPLSFWFNKYNGLSFPLIAMQYLDLRFEVKLRKIEEVAYFEKIYRVVVNNEQKIMTATLLDFVRTKSVDSEKYTIGEIEEIEDINLRDIWDDKGKELVGKLLLDYVYLDNNERQKFARSGHEYLIEYIQHLVFENVQQIEYNAKMDFLNPSKELIWVIHKDVHSSNPTGCTKCKWENFSTGSSGKNPIVNASISFNGYTRASKQVGDYYNFYQPYVYHKISPNVGINLYSFCLFPLKIQPTGTANFSKLSDVIISMMIDRNTYIYTNNDIYPYDSEINFDITIPEVDDFLENIDFREIARNITELEGFDTLTNTQQNLLNRYKNISKLLDQFRAGTNKVISKADHRFIPRKTKTKLYIFDLSLNILRLIGGYGDFAFSGDSV
jgi:hypothetical protein